MFYSECCTYRKIPLKKTGETLKGPDGTVFVTAHWVKKPNGLLQIPVGNLYLILMTQRVTRWTFKEKIKKNTYFGDYKILVINFKFLNKLLDFFLTFHQVTLYGHYFKNIKYHGLLLKTQWALTRTVPSGPFRLFP